MTYEQIERKIFSGKYPMVFNVNQYEEYGVIFADIQVVRQPRSPYFSTQTFPPNGFLGTATMRKNGLVLKRFDFTFAKTRVYLRDDRLEQLILAQQCAHRSEIKHLGEIYADIFGAPAVIPTADNVYTGGLDLSLRFDEMSFQCFADTALQVDVWGKLFDRCQAIFPFPGNPAIADLPIPNDPLEVPTGTPVPPAEFAPPPPGREDDYEPAPGDVAEISTGLPTGSCGERYSVLVRAVGSNFNPSGSFDFLIDCFGPVLDLRIEPSTGGSTNTINVFIDAHDEQCQPLVYPVSQNDADTAIYTFISAQLV